MSFSIDLGLVQAIRKAIPPTVFVETGTFEGETVRRVLPFFEEIHTIELADDYYAKAAVEFGDSSSVEVHHGRSDAVLEKLRPRLKDRAVLYWLDAHWCLAENTVGRSSQCPLLGELEAIGQLNGHSVLLIDDACLFLCPPPKPHESDQWPSFGDILPKLARLSSTHEIMVINDVIVYHPFAARPILRAYALDHAINWSEVLHKSRELDLVKADQAAKEEVIRGLIRELERVRAELAAVLRALRSIESSRAYQWLRRLGDAAQALRTVFSAKGGRRP